MSVFYFPRGCGDEHKLLGGIGTPCKRCGRYPYLEGSGLSLYPLRGPVVWYGPVIDEPSVFVKAQR